MRGCLTARWISHQPRQTSNSGLIACQTSLHQILATCTVVDHATRHIYVTTEAHRREI